MKDSNAYPSLKNLSIFTAVVIMVYVFFPLFPHETKPFQISLFNISFGFPVNFNTLMALVAAILAAAGADWLVETHPKADQRRRFIHWVLPSLTAWAIGVPLSQMVTDAGWWIVLVFGVLILVAVIVGEYIAVDPHDHRFSVASIGLTAVTFALYMIFTVAINGMGIRLYLLLLAVIPFSAFAALRILSLHLVDAWNWKWALVISGILGQITLGLHYFPISAIQFGLLLTGTLYLLVNVVEFIEKSIGWGVSWIAPFTVFILSIGVAVFIRI